MNCAHGIMFHHFHDNEKHIRCQGSLSGDELRNMIDYYSQRHNIISADDYIYKCINNSLEPEDVCLTFDDGLLCQYEVALPVLKEKGLKAFWFIYSSPLEGKREKLEIYHHFRFSTFDDIQAFYEAFYMCANRLLKDYEKELKKFNPSEYLTNSPFYTDEDKRFRYIRDQLLGQERYYEAMDDMMDKFQYNVDENIKVLWMNANNIQALSSEGHIVGIHSCTHPTRMAGNGYEQQMKEYGCCKSTLESIIGTSVIAASYPCGQYNEYTISVMKKLGIKLAFNAFFVEPTIGFPFYEIPREDHSNILRGMKNESNSVYR